MSLETQMPLKRVYECLCSKDRRHPLWVDLYGYFDEEQIPIPEPRVDCSCDNCFYGRDALAIEILRLKRK